MQCTLTLNGFYKARAIHLWRKHGGWEGGQAQVDTCGLWTGQRNQFNQYTVDVQTEQVKCQSLDPKAQNWAMLQWWNTPAVRVSAMWTSTQKIYSPLTSCEIFCQYKLEYKLVILKKIIVGSKKITMIFSCISAFGPEDNCTSCF